jgi:hypothetical protein
MEAWFYPGSLGNVLIQSFVCKKQGKEKRQYNLYIRVTPERRAWKAQQILLIDNSKQETTEQY